MRGNTEADRALSLYADTVRRICLMHLHNRSDVKDVFQETFLKYVLSSQAFESDAHERAWLIRVAINHCKDVRKRWLRKKTYPLEEAKLEALPLSDDSRDLLEAIQQLPANYRNAIYLFYYENYTAVEIARILGRRENTVYTWLHRAKELLRRQLGDDPIA